VHETAILVIAGVLVGGVIAQWLGWRLRVPAIVFLLAGGLIAGPFTGALDPDDTFGELLFPAVSVAVAVILFEGALGLGWRGVKVAGRTVWMLLTVGAFTTLVLTMLAGRLLLDISWDLAVLLACVLVVTGPTVIGPIVRSIGLHGRLAAVLEAEGTLIDPIGAILTVLVFQAAFESGDGGSVVTDLLETLGVGAAIGVVAAAVLFIALRRFLIPDQLHNVTTLAVVIGAFALSSEIRAESGLVAVTVMGISLASQTRVSVRHVLEFNETLRIIFISGLFVLLGARIELDTLRELEWRNIAFLVALVLLVRPVSVFLSTLGSQLGRRERVFLALTAPRGIVAAAIASIFSLRLAEAGVKDSQQLVSATFTVIAGTVLLSGLGSKALGRRLGLLSEPPRTIVVLGANELAIAFAGALEKQGATVRMVDLNRRQLAAARMSGLPTTRGSVFSDDTWEKIGVHQAASFVAMTRNDELNALAARHAAAVLGRKQVFQIPPGRPEHRAWWELPAGTFARPLFGLETTHAALQERMEQGWKVSTTKLTDQFGPQQHADMHPDAIPLFYVHPNGGIDLAAADARYRVRVGDTVVALTAPNGGSNGNPHGDDRNG